MLLRTTLFSTILLWVISLSAQSVFFNEIDYLSNEICVEVVSAPGQDLTDWSVTTYDNNGLVENTTSLTGVPPTSVTPTGYNIIEVDIVFLQPSNGGLIIVDDNDHVIQFISYDGALTAVDGPAAGLIAEDIGVLTTPGTTLQLQGTGTSYPDFDWQVLSSGSCGQVNPDQLFVPLGATLPVELLYFEGRYEESQNLINLSWATASEMNHDYFVLERSADGRVFEALQLFQSTTLSTTEPKIYSYQDYAIAVDQYYYRLRQVDTDGTISFSNLIFVDLPTPALGGSIIFPNPVRDQLKISIPAPDEPIILRLYDSRGQLIKQETIIAPGNLIELNCADLLPGLYQLQLQRGRHYEQHSLLKQ